MSQLRPARKRRSVQNTAISICITDWRTLMSPCVFRCTGRYVHHRTPCLTTNLPNTGSLNPLMLLYRLKTARSRLIKRFNSFAGSEGPKHLEIRAERLLKSDRDQFLGYFGKLMSKLDCGVPRNRQMSSLLQYLTLSLIAVSRNRRRHNRKPDRRFR